MIGKALGHYQITSQLGKGGMSEVFQAKNHWFEEVKQRAPVHVH